MDLLNYASANMTANLLVKNQKAMAALGEYFFSTKTIMLHLVNRFTRALYSLYELHKANLRRKIISFFHL